MAITHKTEKVFKQIWILSSTEFELIWSHPKEIMWLTPAVCLCVIAGRDAQARDPPSGEPHDVDGIRRTSHWANCSCPPTEGDTIWRGTSFFHRSMAFTRVQHAATGILQLLNTACLVWWIISPAPAQYKWSNLLTPFYCDCGPHPTSQYLRRREAVDEWQRVSTSTRSKRESEWVEKYQ